MSEATSLVNRLRLEIARRRVRPKEFFTDFDPLRKGEVSEMQFRRAVSMMNFNLTEPELQELCDKYRSLAGVSYAQFVSDMESAFLDHTATSPVQAAERHLESQRLSVPQQEMVKNALVQFKRIMKVQRILIKPVLQDFDRANTGHVTSAQFIRALTTTGLMPANPDIVYLIVRLYTDSHLGVNYDRFCKDVDNVDTIGGLKSGLIGISPAETTQAKPSLPQNITATRFIDTRQPDNVDPLEVEVRLRAEVAMKRVRASEFFRDFDRLRKGTVGQGQFRSAMGMMNLRVTEADLQSLIEKYRVAGGDVNYLPFCHYIESKPDHLEKLPDARPDAMTDTMAARRRYLNFTEEELHQLHDVLLEYQQAVRNRRVHFRPMFQDFDRTRSGHVSRSQFMRVLNQLSLFPSEATIALLLKRYLDKGNMEEVNYYDFIRDVDQPEAIFTPPPQQEIDIDTILHNHRTTIGKFQYTTKAPVEGTIRRDQPNDIDDLLAKLRLLVKQKRIRLHEFIRDFDRLRSGIITKNQLRSAMSMAQMDLSNSEFDLLTTQFGIDENRVNYSRLIDEIERVFTEKNLEKTNVDVSLPDTNPQYGSEALTREETRMINAVINRFRQFATTQVLDIKSHFQDWDRHNTYKISPKQFRQVLSQFKFYLNDTEFSAVCKKYNDGGMIRYLNFFNDCKRKEIPEVNIGPQAPERRTGGFNVHTPYCMNNPPSQDMNTLLQRVQNIVRSKRIRASEFMVEHDPLRKGTIPIAKFRSGVDNMRMDLTGAEIDALQEYFLVPPDLVNYAAFVEVCEQVFTEKNLEKDPLRRMEGAPSYLDPRDALDAREEEELLRCLERLAFQTTTRRILLKPFFQDKDKVNAGWVTSTRFRSIMSFAGLLISDREFELLCRRFASRRNEVSYLEFLNVMKSLERQEV